jgi:hypothetical protein
MSISRGLTLVSTLAAIVFLGAGPGCSLALDFSNSQIPVDAAIDAPYTADECNYKEPNDTIATAAAFDPTDMGPAAICPGAAEDHDFYKFTVPPGATVVTIKVDFTNALGDLDLRLYDAATSSMQGQSRGFTNEELLVCPGTSPSCPSLAAGDYIFEVFPAVTGATNVYTPSIVIQ